MGNSTPGNLMYIYCDSYLFLLSTFFKAKRGGEREERGRREKMRSKRGCARSTPNLSSAARLLSNCVVLLFICAEYIQFTFAFGVITTFLTCVVHPLKNKGRQKDKNSRVFWRQCSLRGRATLSFIVGGGFEDKQSVKIPQTQQ